MKLFCNPLPLPDVQLGRYCLQPGFSGEDYREMADPTVIRFGERWYLFPSAGLLWWSTDMVDWEHVPIEPFDPGYAPTVAVKGEWLYMTASWEGSGMWRARGPLGPWERIGQRGVDLDGNETWLRDHEDQPVRWGDPCLFVDDDGAMYCYCNLARRNEPGSGQAWNLGSDIGIYGVRLHDDDPTRFAEAPKKLISFDPTHRWEWTGESNQRNDAIILEGAWMTKRRGRYYLQYSCNGTEYRNYALGCYVGSAPTGPFVPQRRNPILLQKGGLVNGCGHHSMVEDARGNLWCFYTILVGVAHRYERRIGIDAVVFDDFGEMWVDGPTEAPQIAPNDPAREQGLAASTGPWLPLSLGCPVKGSSQMDGHEARQAVDNHLRTWWQAAEEPGTPWLEVDLEAEFMVGGVRVLFTDRGLDHRSGVVPGAYGYRVLISRAEKQWTLVVDRSDNSTDRHINFDTWEACPAQHVRLEITRVPPGMRTAVTDLAVFGLAQLLAERGLEPGQAHRSVLP